MMANSDQMTILFVANNGFENMMSLQVLAEEMRERGHKTIFAMNMATNGIITSLNESKHFDDIKTQISSNTEFNLEFDIFRLSAIEVFERFSLKCLWKKFTQSKERDIYYEKLVERIRPHIIILESVFPSPSLTNCGVPWIRLNLGTPNHFFDDKRLPPAFSGISISSQYSDQKKWKDFIEKKNYLMKELSEQLNNWCVSRGVKISHNSLNVISPYLNVYVYPPELDFDLGKTFPPKDWLRISCLMKEEEDKNCPLTIPNELISQNGNLIYLEMGSYGSADINLMKRLTALFSHSPNKFIVSKGPFHYEYQLPPNMWGLENLPHKAAIKASDLVITCGDSNIVTAALFYGKPMIVMPLFGEQLDTAQRVKDTGFGVILEPYKCQLSTTFGSINSMLSDHLVRRRLETISHKMQNSVQIKSLCSLIERIKNY